MNEFNNEFWDNDVEQGADIRWVVKLQCPKLTYLSMIEYIQGSKAWKESNSQRQKKSSDNDFLSLNFTQNNDDNNHIDRFF